MVKSFSVSTDEIVENATKRMEAIVRQSVQEVVDIAQKPVAKGGKMRVQYGFLRASGQMSLNGVPTGPTRPPNEHDGKSTVEWDSTNVILTLGKFKLGDTIYFGWSMNYAKYREVYDGFLASAVQNWPAIVAKNIKAVQS